MDELKKLNEETIDNIQLWEKIKKRPDLQLLAVKKVSTSSGKDTIRSVNICEMMLKDYANADNLAYQELIHNIYTNLDIARISVDDNGLTFLILTLINPNLKLTSEEKNFALWEAYNQIGITKYQKAEADYLKIDKKIASNVKHGTFPYDIRYYILKNNNWNLEEKQKLVYEFWTIQDNYFNFISECEWNLYVEMERYSSKEIRSYDSYELIYDITYDKFLQLYHNKDNIANVWQEIMFLRELAKLRTAQLEDFLDKLKI